MLPKINLAEIYDQNVEKIYRFFYFKIRDQSESEDLTSETFHQFAKKIKESVIENPVSFLYGIAKNLFKEFLRKKYQIITCAYVDENSNFEQYVTDFPNQENSQTPEDILKNYLPQLPEKQREIIELRLIQKLTPTEICTKIQKDLNYVRTTQKRAIKNLRRIIACTP